MPTIAIGLARASISEEHLEASKYICPDYRIVISTDEDDLKKHLDDIEIALAKIPRSLLYDLPKLRWLQQWGAGADWLQQYPELRAKDFIITTASGVHPIQITEHVFALLRSFARQLVRSHEAQRDNKWLKYQHSDVFELEGKTMLIVGVGAIGERIAKVSRAFGMRVVGTRRHADQESQNVDEMVKTNAIHSVLPEADVIVLTLPLTEETRNYIAAKELELMKEDACLINIGRGGTIDEGALARVLEQGKLRGVGLDVFEEEPLAETSPLWAMDRVIITPHYSGLSPRYDERAMDIFLENLRSYQANKPLINVVNKELGY